jgi:hypothetical protein
MFRMRRARRRQARKVLRTVLAGDAYVAEPGSTITGVLVAELLRGNHGDLPGGRLTLQGLRIDGDVDLTYLAWTGRLQLLQCTIDGDLLLEYARIQGEVRLAGTSVREIDAVGARIDGSLTMTDGFRAARGLRGLGLVVTGTFRLSDATLVAPEDLPSRAALDIFRSSFGDIFLSGVTLTGGLYANGVSVSRNIRLYGATITSRVALGWAARSDSGNGVALVNAQVGGAIYFCAPAGGSDVALDGTVSLQGASCRLLQIAPEQLRDLNLDINDASYARLGSATGEDVLAMLDRSPLQTHAYQRLAAYTEMQSHHDLQRRTRIALQRRLAREHRFWSVEGFRRRMLGAFAGYGYRPSLALVWLAACVAAAGVLIGLHPQMFAPSRANPDPLAASHPDGMQAVGLAIDNVVPFVSTGMNEQWVPLTAHAVHWPWLAALTLLKLAGWALALLAAASVTGLIQRK